MNILQKNQLLKKLLANSASDPETNCLIWLKGKSHNGYGKICVNYKYLRTHRLMWQLKKGRIPQGLWVLHDCHNPSCMNIDHLHLGTHADNMREMVAAGRQTIIRGEDRHNAKLTEEEVKMIRKLCSMKVRAKKIAEIFDISVYTVYDINSKRERFWKHVI